MNKLNNFFSFLLGLGLIVLFIYSVTATNPGNEFVKVPVEYIRSLDFYKGKSTIGKKPVPQQTCYDNTGKLCHQYQPKKISCKNYGSRNGRVNWQCKNKLEWSWKLKEYQVSALTEIIWLY